MLEKSGPDGREQLPQSLNELQDNQTAIARQSKSAEIVGADRSELLLTPIRTVADDNMLPKKDTFVGLEVGEIRTRNGRNHVSIESLQDAARWLERSREADPKLDELIWHDPLIEDQGLSANQIANLLRENVELRLTVGGYLLAKLEQPGIMELMPDRVKRNTEKKPSTMGYERLPGLTSREYTALLALSMLDGSFNWKDAESDPETYDTQVDDGLGQHRYAAKVLLTT